MTRIVWGLGTPRTFRPLWALAELGLEYEHRKILSRGPGMQDEHFRTLSKRHKIPFYEDDLVKKLARAPRSSPISPTGTGTIFCPCRRRVPPSGRSSRIGPCLS